MTPTTMASELNKDVLKLEIKGILFPNEKIVIGYRLIKDIVVFTEKRLLIIDSLGMHGRKVYYKVIPYNSITRFTVESTDAKDLDSEIKIYIGSSISPSETFKFDESIRINILQQLLSQAIIDGNLIDMIM